ncbi:MAG: TetR/AcrR family transcriptional regulator [Verrucomicrobiae bacterium]|nr:TetR/AcrR family transcriptional regulator [Verrucomicrobiae bacterium]
MGRVSDARERLLEAMMELIWTGSYGRTSVDHICDRAGVKKGSFYYFFESKSALAVAALDHSWSEYLVKLSRFFDSDVPPVERILRCFRDFRKEQEAMKSQHGRVLGCPIHSLGAEVATTDPELRDRLQGILDEFLFYYEKAIREGQAEGSVVEGDPGLLARMVFAYSEGLLLHARMKNDLAPLDDFERGTLHLLGAMLPVA